MLCAAGDLPAQEVVNAFPHLVFHQPIFLTGCNDGSDRVFVAQQTGVIDVFPDDSATATVKTFLDLSSLISSSAGEEGLLGLAFHPRYAQNGYFYVDYTAPGPLRTVVARYKVSTTDPDKADPLSASVVIEIPQPFSNHNGGMLAFGADGDLYIGMGDGGSEGDPMNYGQDRTALLGKILRIDVDDTTATTHYTIPLDNPFAGNDSGYRQEIWAYGLRNPWRFSFDTITGRLWAGDVGQDSLEEVDIIHGGQNYGWKIMEGFACYDPPSGCDTAGLTMPIIDYGHSQGQAIVGGYVYRGALRPDLLGAYLYGDWAFGKVWMLRYVNGLVEADSLLLTLPYTISSFGVDDHQELYMLAHSFSTATPVLRFAGNAVSRVTEAGGTPGSFALEQNYPNPFNPSTAIEYQIQEPGLVTLNVYDILGREVASLVKGHESPGRHQVTFDGSELSSGIYFYRLTAVSPSSGSGPRTVPRAFVQTRKMMIVR